MVFYAVPHSLASHHQVWRGPDTCADIIARRSESALESGAGTLPVGSFYSNCSPVNVPSQRAPRRRQAEMCSSLGCPLLLRAGVSALAEGSAREPEADASSVAQSFWTKLVGV